MRKIVVTVLTGAICVAPFVMSSASAGERHALRQQLHQDQHARHDAREKLNADIRSGNVAAVAADRAALDAARARVQADKAQLHALPHHPHHPPRPH